MAGGQPHTAIPQGLQLQSALVAEKPSYAAAAGPARARDRQQQLVLQWSAQGTMPAAPASVAAPAPVPRRATPQPLERLVVLLDPPLHVATDTKAPRARTWAQAQARAVLQQAGIPPAAQELPVTVAGKFLQVLVLAPATHVPGLLHSSGRTAGCFVRPFGRPSNPACQ
jgi:hypothetical protein